MVKAGKLVLNCSTAAGKISMAGSTLGHGRAPWNPVFSLMSKKHTGACFSVAPHFCPRLSTMSRPDTQACLFSDNKHKKNASNSWGLVIIHLACWWRNVTRLPVSDTTISKSHVEDHRFVRMFSPLENVHQITTSEWPPILTLIYMYDLVYFRGSRLSFHALKSGMSILVCVAQPLECYLQGGYPGTNYGTLLLADSQGLLLKPWFSFAAAFLCL